MIVDARGKACPGPVLAAEDALSKIAEGMVEVLVENEGSVKNLLKFAAGSGFAAAAEQDGAHWRVRITKSAACMPLSGDTTVSAAQPGAGKDLFLVVSAETIGKDEPLGRILMKGLFETIKAYKELPHTLFFINTGVKLTATENELTPILKELESLGVEIFSCGTCLKYFGLESDLNVGLRGGTTNLLEGMKDFAKMTWIG